MEKLLLVTRGFVPVVGGIEKYTFNVYSRLKQQVIVVAPFEKRSSAFEERSNLKIFRTSRYSKFFSKGKWPLLPLLLWSLWLFFRFRIKQVHCDRVQSGLIGYTLNRLFGVPYLVYTYGMEIAGGGSEWIKGRVLRNANVIVTISEYTKNKLISRFCIDAQKIIKVTPGVDTDEFAPRFKGEALKRQYNLGQRRIILTVGRLADGGRNKGQDYVIRALPQVLRSVPQAAYLIVGEGPDESRLKDLVRELRLEDRVIFAGGIQDDRLPNFYNLSDVFVMVSRSDQGDGQGKVEGFGIVYLEANACGKPVIAGRSGGEREAVSNGETGLLVNSEDIPQIAKAITGLLCHPKEAEKMGKQGRKRVFEEFDWKLKADKIRELVDSLGNT